jgi:CheY-like chemotaxis protein
MTTLQAPAKPQRKRTVLIVDDEDGVLYAIRQTLETLNYRMIATTDSRHALQLVQTDSSIDLLITDLFMPGMDGATLISKTREAKPNLRVVLTTGIASDQQLRRWRARGELIISKPWLDEEFIRIMQKAFSRGRGCSQLGT